MGHFHKEKGRRSAGRSGQGSFSEVAPQDLPGSVNPQPVDLTRKGASRRQFLKQMALAGASAALAPFLLGEPARADDPPASGQPPATGMGGTGSSGNSPTAGSTCALVAKANSVSSAQAMDPV